MSDDTRRAINSFSKEAEKRIRRLDDDGKVKVTRSKLINVACDVIEIVLAKNHDYGDAWQHHGIIGPLIRLSDKLCRLETLADGREAVVVGESIDQTLEDACGYALLALLYRREKNESTRSSQ